MLAVFLVIVCFIMVLQYIAYIDEKTMPDKAKVAAKSSGYPSYTASIDLSRYSSNSKSVNLYSIDEKNRLFLYRYKSSSNLKIGKTSDITVCILLADENNNGYKTTIYNLEDTITNYEKKGWHLNCKTTLSIHFRDSLGVERCCEIYFHGISDSKKAIDYHKRINAARR